jgi:hypothetical protein
MPGQKVTHQPLFNPEKLFLLPFHIKLGLANIFLRLWMEIAVGFST